jgi:hypothetical protein
MDVVIGAADFMTRASKIAARAGDVFEQFLLDFDIDPWWAVLRTKDDV